MTNDEGGPSYPFGQEDSSPRRVDLGANRVESSEFEALLGAEDPPTSVWRKLQAQLRREGIIH